MMIPKTDSQVLQEARRLLVEEGWTQGIMERWVHGESHPRRCVGGALDLACRGDRLQHTRIVTVLGKQWLKAGAPTQRTAHGWLVAWNDSPTRTKDDVLALIDKALEAVTK